MRYQIITALCIGYILWFTILPVEQYWCETDIQFTEVICGVSVVAVLMLVWRKQQVTLSAIDIIVVLWFIYVMLRSYVDSTYPCANFILRVMQMTALYVCLRILFSSVMISEKNIVFIVLICAIYEVILGAGQMINGGSRHYLFPMTGSFLNPGPYSIFLSMGLVMSCQMRKEYYTGKGVFTSMTSCLPVVFLVLLPATWSRAALLSAVICLGVIYWDKWKRWKWQVAFVIVLIMIGLYFMKKGSADGRSIIYMISLLNILQHPLFGSGISSFRHQYAEGMATFSTQHPTFDFLSADVTSNAYNCLLQIGVEQGIIGMGVSVVLIAMLFIKLNKRVKILGMGLLCLLIFSMFSYPFEQLPYQIIFVMITAYVATDVAECVLSTKWHIFCRCYLSPVVLCSAVILFSIFIYKQIRERVRAESDYRMMAGVSNTAFIDDYYELLPLMASNEHFLFDFAKMLASDGRYNDSNAMLRLGTLISCDPMFYVIQGNNYSEMGFYQYAEQAYKEAFNIMPNRIYPLYQLMLLYEKEGGKFDKIIEVAQRIVYFNIKIRSPATDEILHKAKDILYQSRDNTNITSTNKKFN